MTTLTRGNRPTLLRLASALLVGALLAFGARAATDDMHILIGSYTHDSDSPGILRLRFDPKTGQIDPKPVQTLTSDNPSWLVLDEERGRLYATNENGPAHDDPVGRVSAWQLDSTGDHQLIGQNISLGDEPTHASLSHDGRYLFISNYGSRPNPGGSLAVMPLAEDGHPLPVTQMLAHQSSGVHPERQQSAHVHSAVPSPDGKRLLVSDLGADRVFVYRYDPSNAERPLQPDEPASIELPAGSGPRHLVFHPNGKHAYLALELSAQVASFDYTNGTLTRRQLLDLKEAGSDVRHSPGAIHTSADGRFLYVSDRGDYNHIIVFAIEADGTLREIQRRSSEGREPREFAITPDGRFMLIANQLSDALVVIRRDAGSGALGETLQTLPAGRPSDIKLLAPN
jgi:6-phosphogluconolactonase (cycloisomerase 2 family)